MSRWRAAAARADRRAIACYAVLLIAAAFWAYYSLFLTFQPYDDEGTMLLSLAGFVRGDTLYRDIYAQYGPLYFELFGGLFAVTGKAVTTDAGRAIVLVIWLATGLLFGLTTQRLTRSLPFGLAGTCVGLIGLGVLVNEPMHPVGLCLLLLAGLHLLMVSASGRRAGIAAGVLIGALAMTKLNLGGFAAIAALATVVLTTPALRRRSWLAVGAGVLTLLVPFLLMAGDLDLAWARDYAVLVALGALAVIVAAWRRGLEVADEQADDGVRWIVQVAVAAVATSLLLILILLLTGPSVSDVIDGIVSEGARLRDVFVVPFSVPGVAADWGIAAVAAAAATLVLRSDRLGSTPWPGVLRIVAGLAIWFRVTQSAPITIGPSANQDALLIVLAWIAAVPPAGGDEPPYLRRARVFLPLLAVLETLQAYPVAGSQIGASAVLFTPVGALCLADGIRALRADATSRVPAAVWMRRIAVLSTALGVALVAKFAWGGIVRPGISNAQSYHSAKALPFAGATRVRLAPETAGDLARVVTVLRKVQCTALIGYPSVNSLYLWSFIDPPRETVPGAWMRLLDAERQQRVVDELRSSEKPCLVRNDTAAANWLSGLAPPDGPLVRYISTQFTPGETIGPWQVLLPAPGATA